MTEFRQRGAGIQIEQLCKRYGGFAAVDDLSLSIAPGEFITLLGPSGSGKTTTLNLLAGFLRPDSGRVSIGGQELDRVPAHKRDLGVVFQNYALFPHMTAAENVAFGLRQRRIPKDRREQLVAAAFETVRLAGMERRRPSELSGGQQQRVALARAIAFEPRVLLMDEPLGALDRALREGMQLEIRRIHRELGSTVVFVTHDQEEALALSDRIAVFDGGRVQQVGTSAELYDRPETLFVAQFIGESTILFGTVAQDIGGQRSISFAGRPVRAPGLAAVGSRGAVVIRPERLSLRPHDAAIEANENAVPVTVTDSVYLGASRKLAIELPDGLGGLVRETAGRLSPLHPGDSALLTWLVDDGVLLTADEHVPAPQALLDDQEFTVRATTP